MLDLAHRVFDESSAVHIGAVSSLNDLGGKRLRAIEGAILTL